LRNYYYFVAALPSVSYGDPPPVSSREFRERCGYFLSPGDAALLGYCRYDAKTAIGAVKPTGAAFIDRFLARERALILNLAFLRAAKLKWQSPGDPPYDGFDAAAAAKAAFEMNDPLAAELFIDQGRWEALDSMVGLDLFSVNNIYAHLMKLQLLERKQLFDIAKGSAEYKKLYDTILNEYNSSSEAGA
jgi:hypothetical protein